METQHIRHWKRIKAFCSRMPLLASAALLCLSLLGQFERASAAETYTLAVTPQFEHRKLFEIWKPIVAELEKRTGLSFKLVTSLSLEEYEQEVAKGGADFIYVNPYLIVQEHKSQGYLPLVRDRTPIHGILVVRKDSPIHNAAELNGKTVAFPSPNALGGGLLPRADLDQLFHVKVVPVYAKSHTSVYMHVLNGLADAGGGVEKTLREQEKPIQDALRVIYTTREAPSLPVAVHPRVSKENQEKVRRAFLDMATTPESLELLARVPMKQPVSTSLDEYLVMQKWKLDSYWVKEF